MTKATVGQWGDTLAVRLPRDIAQAAGLVAGGTVELELMPGGLSVTSEVQRDTIAAQTARAAAADMIGERRNFSLGTMSIQDFIDEGRRS